MEKILIFLFLLSFSSIFSQENSFQKTDYLFTVNYSDSTNQKTNQDKISITGLDNEYLYFTKVYNRGDNITPPKDLNYKIRLENINSFGYLAHTTLGTRIGTGVAIGFGTGALLGILGSNFSMEGSNDKSALGFAAAGGLACGMIGGFIGAATGIGANEYESVSLSKYQPLKKSEMIQKLILKGVKFNEDDE